METTQIDSKPVKVMKYQIHERSRFPDIFEEPGNRLLEITIKQKPTRKVTPGKYYKVTGFLPKQLPPHRVLKEGAELGYESFTGIMKLWQGKRVKGGLIFEVFDNIHPYKSHLYGMTTAEILTLHEVLEIKEIPVPYEYVSPSDPRSKEMTPFRIQEAV